MTTDQQRSGSVPACTGYVRAPGGTGGTSHSQCGLNTFVVLRPALRAALVLAASLALAFQPAAVDAVTLTWAKVSGTWDTTSLNWTGTSGSTTWPAVSSGTDTAIFGSSGGTVTLSGTITADALNFNANGYTITGGTSLQLDGSTPKITVASGITATINSAISGTTGFNKTGPGTLVVGGASTETGPVSITPRRASVKLRCFVSKYLFADRPKRDLDAK
jgi:autotransporter-associated beta strand protein